MKFGRLTKASKRREDGKKKAKLDVRDDWDLERTKKKVLRKKKTNFLSSIDEVDIEEKKSDVENGKSPRVQRSKKKKSMRLTQAVENSLDDLVVFGMRESILNKDEVVIVGSKRILDESLRVTKGGKMRSDAEITGLQNRKREQRKKEKVAEALVRKEKDKKVNAIKRTALPVLEDNVKNVVKEKRVHGPSASKIESMIRTSRKQKNLEVRAAIKKNQEAAKKRRDERRKLKKGEGVELFLTDKQKQVLKTPSPVIALEPVGIDEEDMVKHFIVEVEQKDDWDSIEVKKVVKSKKKDKKKSFVPFNIHTESDDSSDNSSWFTPDLWDQLVAALNQGFGPGDTVTIVFRKHHVDGTMSISEQDFSYEDLFGDIETEADCGQTPTFSTQDEKEAIDNDVTGRELVRLTEVDDEWDKFSAHECEGEEIPNLSDYVVLADIWRVPRALLENFYAEATKHESTSLTLFESLYTTTRLDKLNSRYPLSREKFLLSVLHNVQYRERIHANHLLRRPTSFFKKSTFSCDKQSFSNFVSKTRQTIFGRYPDSYGIVTPFKEGWYDNARAGISALMGGKTEEVGEIVNLVCYFFLILKEDTIVGRMSIVKLFLAASKVDFIDQTMLIGAAGLFDTFFTTIGEFSKQPEVIEAIAEVDEGIVTEAKDGVRLSDQIRNLGSILHLVLSSSVVEATRNLIVTLASLRFLPKEVAFNVFRTLGKPKAGDIFSLLTTTLDDVATLVRVGEGLSDGVELSELLLTKDPVSSALAVMQELHMYRELVYTGLPVEGRMDIREYLRKASEALPIIESFLKRGNPLASNFSFAQDLYTRLLPVVDGYRGQFGAQTRQPPFAFVLHGAPGVGKSTILDWIFRIHADVKGRRYDSSHVFHRVTGSEYWETYQPWSHCYVHYSEIGNKAAKTVQSQGDDMIEELTSVIDSQPKPLNCAFNQKGKVFFGSEVVGIDTNCPDMNLALLYKNPAAYNRRFVFIEVNVLKDFRVEGSNAIDPAKGPERRLVDKYQFRIYRKVPSDNSNSNIIELYDGEVDGAYRILYDLMVKHLQVEESILARKLADIDTMYGMPKRPFVINAYDVADVEAREEANLEVKEELHPDVATESLELGAFASNLYWMFVARFFPLLGIFVSEVFNFISSNVYATTVGALQQRIYNLYMKSILIFISLYLLFFSNVWLKIIGIFVLLNLNASLQLTTVSQLRQAPLQNPSGVHSSFRRLKNFLVGDTIDFFSLYKYETMVSGLILSLPLILVALRTFLAKTDEHVTEAHTDFKEENDLNEKLNNFEEQIGASERNRRIANKVQQGWNVLTMREQVKHTDSAVTLSNSIRSNVRLAKVEFGDKIIWTSVFGVRGEYFVINTHAIPKEGNFSVSISMKGNREHCNQFKTTLVEPKYRRDLGEDITIVRLCGISAKDIIKHLTLNVVDKTKGSIMGQTIDIRSGIVDINAKNKIHGMIHYTKPFSYMWSAHEVGMCGTPVCAEIGKGAVILGIHVAGDKNSHMSFGVHLVKEKVVQAIGELDAESALMTIVSQSDDVTSLYMPKEKSPFRYEELNQLEYYGYTGEPVTIGKGSKLKLTPLATDLPKIFRDNFNFAPSVRYVPPLMHPVMTPSGTYISPFNVNLLKMNVARKFLERSKLEKCVEHFVERVCAELPCIQPLTFEDAINGSVDDDFLRRMNAATGAGYGFKGKKFNYLPVVYEGDAVVIREMNGKLKGMVNSKICEYMNGCSSGTIFSAKLKDEPRDVIKVVKGKTRMFYPAPLDALVIARQFLAPIFTLMVEKRDLFNISVGINMHLEGDAFYKTFVEFADSDECLFDGDYGGFDTSMPFEIGHAAASVVIGIAVKLGYNAEALKVLSAILSDNLSPLVEVNGDVFGLPGLMTSGSYGTAEFNCIRNQLMMMYYFECHPNLSLHQYDTCFLKRVYGDDVTGVVKKEIAQDFNNVLYAEFCDRVLGMEFTTPNKEKNVVPLRHISELNFLKRRFVRHPDAGDVRAVLDLESIYKTLQWSLISDKVSQMDQLLSTVNSALWEIWMHVGREQFDKCRADIILSTECRTSYHFREGDFHDWLRICQTLAPPLYLTAMALRGEEELSYAVSPSVPDKEDDVSAELDVITESRSGKKRNGQSQPLRSRRRLAEEIIFLREQRDACAFDLKEAEEQLHVYDPMFGGLNPLELRKFSSYALDSTYRKNCDDYILAFARVRRIKATITVLERAIAKRNFQMRISTESDEVAVQKDGVVSPDQIMQDENFVDVAGDEFKMTNTFDGYVAMDTGNDLGMEGFLKRPIRIAQFAIPMATDVDTVYDIWDLFTSDPTIRAKLRNYAFAKFSLKIRISISGTPFHYGKVMVAYLPFQEVNAAMNLYQATPSRRADKLRYLSSLPGTKVMDVRENDPFEMHVPYVSPQPMARLFNSSNVAVGLGTPFSDFDKMGAIYISTLNQVKGINETVTPVYVYVYAFAEDITLSGATGTILEVQTESDERQTGPVERASSSMLQVSNALSTVPMIGYYARASSIVLSMMKDVSAHLGWSYPVMIDRPMRMKGEAFQNGAQVIGMDTGKRLTLDPKQELTVDPRITGSMADEMTIASIAHRESLLNTFEWEASDTPMSIMQKYAVTPKVGVIWGSPFIFTQPTNLAFAAMPFHYWRGKIIFRIEIVCSNFHRGKLLIGYEPNVSQSGLILTALDINKQYMKVIDIQETQCVEIEVDWNHVKPYCQNLPNYALGTTVNGTLGLNQEPYVNGVLFISPFTELQSPDTSNVPVNVYVRGEDMTFNRLTSAEMPLSRKPAIITTESDDTDGLCETTKFVINKAITKRDHINQDYFGEVPVSFRALLKRFWTGYSEAFTVDASAKPVAILPVYPDYAAGDNALQRGNNLYEYLRYAYLGMRGGLRRRLIFANAMSGKHVYNVQVSLMNNTDATMPVATSFDYLPQIVSMDGTVMFNTDVNSGIEFEVPFYSNNIFAWACGLDPWNVSSTTFVASNLRNFLVMGDAVYTVADSETFILREYIAAGEDFSLLRYLAPYPMRLS